MPPLARNLIDTNAVAVLAGWINSLPGVPALAPPAISPPGGNFTGLVNVAITPPNTNAQIYYTLDGSLPTTNSSLYTGLIRLTNGATTVSANAFEAGFTNSVAATALFVVQPLYLTGQGLGGQAFQIRVAGSAGSNYVLEASTNLISWSPIMTNAPATNIFILTDTNAGKYSNRYYRIIQQ